MTYLSRLAACTLLSAWSLSATAQMRSEPLPWEPWNDIRQVALVGGNHGSYLASSYCLDGCRYDRTSVDVGRGGQRFIRIESTPDGEQGVLFEQPGAGAITRIWMTTGDGVSTDLPANVRLRVYFDGEAKPAIDMSLADYFREPANTGANRATSPVPLGYDRTLSSGGNVSYLQLPYRHGIKVALLHGADLRLWYQLNYTQVPDGTPIAAFGSQAQFQPLAWLLAQPWLQNLMLAKRLPISRDRVIDPQLGPGERIDTLTSTARSQTIWRAEGRGWLRGMRIRVDRSRIDDLRIVLTFDGERTVDLPLAEFFTADTLDAQPPRGLFAGLDIDGAFYSTIPMPYRSSASIELRMRDGAGGPRVQLRSSVQTDPTPPPDNAGTFRAYRHASCPTTPMLSGDEVLLAHTGTGRLLGLAMWMTGDGTRSGGYYLEGDERLYFDGSVQPLWYGTGVEDLFNGGFYFDQREFSHPLTGATLVHRGGTDDATSMYRWFLTDAPSWRQSIIFKMGNGAYGTEPMCLRSVAFYYGEPAPAQSALASLQLGDTVSEAAAHYQRGIDSTCSAQTATFGDESPTSLTARVCRGTTPSRFVLAAATAGTNFRLRRTFDAGIAGQAADLWVNGTKVGAWPNVQANPARRWSQMDVDFALPAPAVELAFEIRPLGDGMVSESSYELWGASAHR